MKASFCALVAPNLLLPGEVLPDEVRLGQSLVTAAVVHDGRGRGHRKDRAAFGAYSGGVLFLCRAYGQPRFFRHGSNKPLLATATTGTLAELPSLTLGPEEYATCRRVAEGLGKFSRRICVLERHSSP